MQLETLTNDIPNYFQSVIMPQIRNNEEQVLKQVLKQILHREPREKDAKKCTKLYEAGEPMNYMFAYKDQVLGKVTFDFAGNEIIVKFTPKV